MRLDGARPPPPAASDSFGCKGLEFLPENVPSTIMENKYSEKKYSCYWGFRIQHLMFSFTSQATRQATDKYPPTHRLP